MHPISILLLGLAMSTDAFAAAIGKGAAMGRPRVRDALRTGLVFGVVEGLTPLIGWLLGAGASSLIEAWDHWIAFVLLLALGLHMIHKALHEEAPEDPGKAQGRGLWGLALAGLATSIDALAVGVGLAFVDVNILVVSAVIGLCTFVMVSAGVLAGRAVGQLVGRWAEIVGGLVLIVVGAMIVYEHVYA
jgi:putative Mn2+ efflux pump MntP